MLPFQRLADCPEYRPTLPTHPLSTHPSSACRMPVGLNRPRAKGSVRCLQGNLPATAGLSAAPARGPMVWGWASTSARNILRR